MVRSGGKPYRTDAQKHGGGKTRRQQLSEKLRSKKRRLREKGLVEMKCHAKPANICRRDNSDLGVYGLYKDEDASHDEEWVLTALSITDDVEKMNHHRGRGHSSMEVRGRYVLTPYHKQEIDPRKGLEISRFEKKSEAMSKIRADGSNRVEHGYVVRPAHNPRTLHGERFDKEAWRQFKRNATKVYED